MDIRELQKQVLELERVTALRVRAVQMKVERVSTGVAPLLLVGAVPDELTDLDTTVTGAELNAKHLAGAVGDLGQTISATYVEAEVQAISDKVDEVIALLRTAQIANALLYNLLDSGGNQLLDSDGNTLYTIS